jgi:hypothetical protein
MKALNKKAITQIFLLLVSTSTNFFTTRRANTFTMMQHVRGFSLPYCPKISSRQRVYNTSLRMALDDASLDALWERRNTSRQKFGLKPLSREEFAQVQEQARVQAEKQRLKFRKQEPQQPSQIPNKASIVETILSSAVPQVCETNDDCSSSGELCCDFLFQKVCCSNGLKDLRQRPALIPVPVKSSHLG